jgi:hypothetical protein
MDSDDKAHEADGSDDGDGLDRPIKDGDKVRAGDHQTGTVKRIDGDTAIVELKGGETITIPTADHERP